MKSLLVGLVAVALLTGCSGLARDVGATIIKENKLEDKQVTVCYDLWDKKDCPKSTKQYDRKLLPFWWNPLTSRFCVGLTETSSVSPEGMYCYNKDIIK